MLSAIQNKRQLRSDRNISLALGWNLIGYSSENVNLSLEDAVFTNSSGSSYTWAQALANNKQQAYLAYYDSSSALASGRKYKYLSTVSGLDDTAFRNKKGYWLYSNESGNLSLPGVGGSKSGESYEWGKLSFSNGSDELNVTDARDTYNWVMQGTGAQTYINYWDAAADVFYYICDNLDICEKTTLSSWEGVFVYSNVDNLTLIRQN